MKILISESQFKNLIKEYNDGGADYIKCDHCYGLGKMEDGKMCDKCDGTGKMSPNAHDLASGTDRFLASPGADTFAGCSPPDGPNTSLTEKVEGDKVICDKCGWSWDISDGEKDPYTCHKCGNKHAELEENINPNGRKTLNFFDLVSKRIIWITEPHTNGERDKPNWEHDTNVITLWNVEHPEPGQEWVRQAIHFPKNNSVKWWNDVGQFQLSDDKYNQILRSIEIYNKRNEKDKDAKFITCRNCRHKFTQTTHKKKKSLPICPTCGTHNKEYK